MHHHSGVEHVFEPSDEVTITGGGIELAISNFNDLGYCSILKSLVILCKHASENSCVTFSISINSTICVFITSFSEIWLSIPAGSNKYTRRKLRVHILVSFLTQSCGLDFFIQGGLDLDSGLVLDKNRVQQCRAPKQAQVYCIYQHLGAYLGGEHCAVPPLRLFLLVKNARLF